VLTWDDQLVAADPVRYRKINYAQRFRAAPYVERPRKHVCMIACNKRSGHHTELYTERLRAIRWFEACQPTRFDLYGIGWDDGSPVCFSYRGPVARKRDVLSAYDFAICYENNRGFPGYITEKIFDCLFAGTVPIYLGAPNIAEHIPSGCYIDAREFEGFDGIDYARLWAFLARMPAKEYRGYLDAAAEFLIAEACGEFSISAFVETMISTLEEGSRVLHVPV
jgi:hypothetical protein